MWMKWVTSDADIGYKMTVQVREGSSFGVCWVDNDGDPI